jgi:hypothetical protein
MSARRRCKACTSEIRAMDIALQRPAVFCEVNIQSYSAELTVDLRDITGVSVFSKTLQPETSY